MIPGAGLLHFQTRPVPQAHNSCWPQPTAPAPPTGPHPDAPHLAGSLLHLCRVGRSRAGQAMQSSRPQVAIAQPTGWLRSAALNHHLRPAQPCPCTLSTTPRAGRHTPLPLAVSTAAAPASLLVSGLHACAPAASLDSCTHGLPPASRQPQVLYMPVRLSNYRQLSDNFGYCEGAAEQIQRLCWI